MWASFFGYSDVVDKLLKAGANPLVEDKVYSIKLLRQSLHILIAASLKLEFMDCIDVGNVS